MLTIDDLLNIETKLNLNDVSLQTLSELYERYLLKRTFIYEIEDGDVTKKIKLRFKESDFCHLIGIQNIKKGRNYSGQSGFDAIKNGTVTIPHLMGLYQGARKKVKGQRDRIVCFSLLPRILANPTIIPYAPNKPTSIQSDFVLYDYFTGVGFYLHLGIAKNNDPVDGFYHPKTFVESDNDGKFIKGNDPYTIKSIVICVDGTSIEGQTETTEMQNEQLEPVNTTTP